MALAIHGSSTGTKLDSTGSVNQLTTGSFTPPAGALVVAVATEDPNSPGDTGSFATPTGSLSAWTNVIGYNNFDGSGKGGIVYIGYATVNSSVSTTVRVNWSRSSDCQLYVYVITGANNANPIATTNAYTVNANHTLSYTAQATGSMFLIAGQSYTPSTSMSFSGTTTDSTLSVDSTGYIGHQTTVSSGLVTQNINVTTSGTNGWALGMVEVVPSGASGGSLGGGVGSGSAGTSALAAHGYTLKINGVDRTGNMVQDGWSLSQSWGRQADTATIVVFDEYPGANANFVPRATQTVELKDTTLNLVLFGGVIQKPELTVVSNGVNQWVLNCVSYTFWADTRVVSYSYANMSMGQIIRDLTGNASAGLTANSVVTGPSITSVTGKFEPLSKAWSKVTAMASTQTTYGWWVDGLGDLHVSDEATAQSSGVTFTDVPTNSHANSEAHYQDGFKFSWDGTSLANRVYTIGGNVPQQQSDHWSGNGNRRTFALTYPVDSNAQVTTALKVGGKTTVVSTQTTDPWYLEQSQATGLWNLTASTTAQTPTPANGVSIDLTYGYTVTQVSIVQNTTSVSQYSGGNGGYFDTTVADQNLLTLAATNQRGQHAVAEYGYAQEQVVLTTTEDWQGWVNVGQTMQFISAYTPDSANAYNNGINKKFLIVSIQARGVGGGYRTVQVTAIRVS